MRTRQPVGGTGSDDKAQRRGALGWLSATFLSMAAASGCGGAATEGPNPELATAAPATSQTAAPAPRSGPKAPDFSLRALSGGSVRLSDYRGKKVVLLDFWATTCHPCLQEMPELVAIYHQYRDQGFEILAIATDDPDTRAQVSAEVRSKKMDFPVLLDDETVALDRYNPKGELPFAVLIDRNGAIVLKRASYQAGDEESLKSLRAAIESALAAP